MPMRILIANRGEIACRIAATVRRMGLTSIAVYSDADRDARHVRVADEAYALGGAAPADSYLNVAAVIALAGRVRADAVHPGYGFLSENAAFAQACADASLLFIGPPAAAILAMGSKSASKAAMARAGVPVAPGYHGADQSAATLQAEAVRAGFPLIIKASAGGGGKGMQVVNSAAEVPAAVESARRLARTAFGDDRLLFERYFAKARHVEVQIFADTQGHVVSLFDRDCSVQRRHQKIIEEAPAPGLRDDVRAAMSAAAITAARTVGYVGAGTIEFLLDEAQHFYFMEMNTRLQVEHPVTELVTGIDLVEWQIRVARGEALPQDASTITRRGCAIEARVCAEDPAHDYLPSVGRIDHLRWPETGGAVRVDSGVDAGDAVSPFYDSLLGKIIAWGDSRGRAVAALADALQKFEIIGVTTNRALLAAVLADEEFERGGVGTDFLGTRGSHLAVEEAPATDLDRSMAALWYALQDTRAAALWLDTRGWRLGAPPVTRWRFDGHTVLVESTEPDGYRVGPEGDLQPVRAVRQGRRLDIEAQGSLLRYEMVELAGRLYGFGRGRRFVLRLERPEDALDVAGGPDAGSLLTPLPGTVVAVHVAVGQHVAQGDALVTVEAMKMEHTLTAPYAGVVAALPFSAQDRIAAGSVLAELTPDAGIA